MSTDIARRENQGVERTQERPFVQPPVDIYENQDEYLLIADMPGVTKNNLHIHLDEERITVEGRVDTERTDAVLSQELERVDFQRTFQVPASIDREKVAAEFNHGVLRLHLPKLAAVKPRQIEVRAG